MSEAAAWYLTSSLLGWFSVPFARRILSRLPDRGFGLSRVVGLLAAGYLLWFGATTGILHNSLAGVLTAIALWAALNAWLAHGHWRELGQWVRENARLIIVTELLFLSTFALWALVRSYSPEVLGTEKPMELAFLNSIVSSEAFPPRDPWLSGHAISYYYFGYVMAGLITTVSGAVPSVAFNLTSVLWFALVAVASYAIVYNLISLRAGGSRVYAGLLGPLFVLVMGNLEGFLEILHTRHLFWTENGTSRFWSWLDLKSLDQPPLGELAFVPSRHWWWWRASRVVRDVNLAGTDIEVIDEFPFFSFILADIHPHVLALPFVLLALAFVLNLYLLGEWQAELLQPKALPILWHRYARAAAGGFFLLTAGARFVAGVSGPGASVTFDLVGSALLRGILATAGMSLVVIVALVFMGHLRSALDRRTLFLAAWIFGGLAFLNAWDFPIYLSLLFFVLLYLGRARGWLENLRISLTTTLPVALTGILIYGFWYPTFSSQASGILPNLGFPTKIQHFVIMFAPLLAPLTVWLVRRGARELRTNWVILVAGGVGAGLVLFVLSWVLAGLLAAARGPLAINAWVDQMAALSLEVAVRAALARRAAHPWTPLVLGLSLSAVWVSLRQRSGGAFASVRGETDLTPFVLILVGTASLLVIGPEFFYLRDLFGTRMNTVFKFYYAAWILWGLAAAYASHDIWSKGNGLAVPWRVLTFVIVLLGLCYPVMSVLTRTTGFRAAAGRSLDGSDHLDANRPMEALAIDWINQNLSGGVVAEAVGGSYSMYARVSTYTPLTTVLGWDWHEIQWRGSADAQGSRRGDIARLYETRNWREASEIVNRYSIDYVFVGPLERSTYRSLNEEKFGAFMTPIYENEAVRIFSAEPRASIP